MSWSDKDSENLQAVRDTLNPNKTDYSSDDGDNSALGCLMIVFPIPALVLSITTEFHTGTFIFCSIIFAFGIFLSVEPFLRRK